MAGGAQAKVAAAADEPMDEIALVLWQPPQDGCSRAQLLADLQRKSDEQAERARAKATAPAASRVAP